MQDSMYYLLVFLELHCKPVPSRRKPTIAQHNQYIHIESSKASPTHRHVPYARTHTCTPFSLSQHIQTLGGPSTRFHPFHVCPFSFGTHCMTEWTLEKAPRNQLQPSQTSPPPELKHGYTLLLCSCTTPACNASSCTSGGRRWSTDNPTLQGTYTAVQYTG